MKFDPVDAFSSGFGWAIRQVFLFLAAIWVGSMLGAFAVAGGVAADGGGKIEFLLFPPTLLLSPWMFLNALLLAAFFFLFIRDSFGPVTWGVFAGLESLMALLGFVGELEEWYAKLAAWGAWLLLNGMLGYALWFLRQWRINKWAGEMAMLHAENEMRKAELRAQGIATFDRDPD